MATALSAFSSLLSSLCVPLSLSSPPSPSSAAAAAAASSSSASFRTPSTAPFRRLLSRPTPSAARGSRLRARANPTDMSQKLTESIQEAEEVCAADSGSGECAAAWDEVEELSAEIAHKRVQSAKGKDPLEAYCKEAPEADECRVYED